MIVTKKILKDYLDYGLIDETEASLVLKKSDQFGINDQLKTEIIQLLEKNIKKNEAELADIEKEELILEKKENEVFKEIKREAKLKGKEIAKERYDRYKLVTRQQEEILNDFELEMDRLDRKLDELVSEKKTSFEKTMADQILNKIKTI